jgi:hypothetical protein
LKLALAAALVAAATMTALPERAAASPSIRYGIQDDAYLAAGPTLERNLGTLDELGAKLVRYMVNWRQIAATRGRSDTGSGNRARSTPPTLTIPRTTGRTPTPCWAGCTSTGSRCC